MAIDTDMPTIVNLQFMTEFQLGAKQVILCSVKSQVLTSLKEGWPSDSSEFPPQLVKSRFSASDMNTKILTQLIGVLHNSNGLIRLFSQIV